MKKVARQEEYLESLFITIVYFIFMINKTRLHRNKE